MTLFKLLLFGIIALNLTGISYAESDRNWSFGALVGVAALQGGSVNSAGGIMLRDRFTDHLALGIVVTQTSLSEYAINSTIIDKDLYHLNFDFLYYIIDGLWLGPRLGWAYLGTTENSTNTSYSGSVIDWGPAVGFDLHPSRLVTAGLDLSYMTSQFSPTHIKSFQAFLAIKLNW